MSQPETIYRRTASPPSRHPEPALDRRRTANSQLPPAADLGLGHDYSAWLHSLWSAIRPFFQARGGRRIVDTEGRVCPSLLCCFDIQFRTRAISRAVWWLDVEIEHSGRSDLAANSPTPRPLPQTPWPTTRAIECRPRGRNTRSRIGMASPTITSGMPLSRASSAPPRLPAARKR